VDESELRLDGGGTPDGAETDTGGMPTLGFWDFARMILVLAGVVGAIYLLFYLLKRTAAGRNSSSAYIKHIGSLTLPGNKWVHLVDVGEQMFLVGASDNGLNLISEITDQETRDEIRVKHAQESEPPRRTFSEMFASVFGNGNGGAAGTSGFGTSGFGAGGAAAGGSAGSGNGRSEGRSGGNTNPFSFIQGQRERLRNLK
jgi:flagellar protein FliO/FliZ